MIKYMGISVTYVQYMPANMTKHGIKVFAIYCDLSGILLFFKFYVVQEYYSNNIDLIICDDMVKEDGLNIFRGRTLYTDNYYTSMAIAKHIFN